VTRRRFLAPEVVQTSAMDCGPAALKCLLDGFDLPVSYGRLREVCQTQVDGTSVDTLEEVAGQLGLDAEQVMIPADHLLLPGAEALPAILVVRLPRGDAHFVVVWRRVGPLVQVMDPARGRHWVTVRALLEQALRHTLPVPAAAWREWAGSDEHLAPVRRRLAALGLGLERREALVEAAVADPGWRSPAALDAATRTVAALVGAGALRRGREAAAALETLVAAAVGGDDSLIPEQDWSVVPAPLGPEGEERLLLRGAVLVRVRGRLADGDGAPAPAPLDPELANTLRATPERPLLEALRMLVRRGALGPGLVLGLALLAAAAVVVEALLFRGLLDARRDLVLAPQRLAAIGLVVAFVAGRWLLQGQLVAGALRLGRLLEGDLRLALLRKIPRLGDAYFRSRLTSDMADRAHRVHAVRTLPWLGAQLVAAVAELLATVAGLVWLDRGAAPLAVAAAAVAVGMPLLARSVLAERDLRLRTHAGALARFDLDALLGLVAVKAHGAERTLRREHELLLVEWARAGDRLRRAVLASEAVQSAIAFALVIWLVAAHAGRSAGGGAVLLLLYWALKLPVLGQEVAQVARQLPLHRSLLLRTLEPLGAPAEDAGAAPGAVVPTGAVAFRMEGVSVRAAGHSILAGVDLDVAAGEHVAVVGRSGAGKSTLVGLLLGWHRPAGGTLTVDGEQLDGAAVAALRRRCAWVDPAVWLWNRSLLENVLAGTGEGERGDLHGSFEDAELWRVVERLPAGLETPLGEGGGFLSGGEGQRVRLARALLRGDAGLAILDEPFRGLDRGQRARLLARARERWRGSTLLCVTHDVGETRAFPRVVVVDAGRVVEDGAPEDLLGRPGSRYRALVEAEEEVRERLWGSPAWRHVVLADGRVTAAGEGG